MGHIRSQFVTELKMFLDLSKPQTGPEFEALNSGHCLNPTKTHICDTYPLGNKQYSYGMAVQN